MIGARIPPHSMNHTVLHRIIIGFLAVSLACSTGMALAKRNPKGVLEEVEQALANRGSQEVPATGSIEVAFSPNEGSEALVLKVIDSAKREIRLLSYSFTSAP